MRRSMMLALSVALLVPAVTMAQRPEARGPRGDRREMPMRGGPGGVAFMLENAEELKLTEDQVNRLRAIQTRFDERTAPLRARADSLRPMRENRERESGDTAQLRQRRQAASEVMTQLRSESESARTEALALLSGDQQKKVQELADARRKEMQSRRGRRGPGEGRRGGDGRRGGGPPAHR